MNDPISRPSHYAIRPNVVEPIDLIQSQNLNGLQANVVKYVCRYPHKDGTKDLEKALQYLIWLYTQERLKGLGVEWTVNGKNYVMPEFCLELIDNINKCMPRGLEIKIPLEQAKLPCGCTGAPYFIRYEMCKEHKPRTPNHK